MDGDEIITIVCRYPPPVAPVPAGLPAPMYVKSSIITNETFTYCFRDMVSSAFEEADVHMSRCVTVNVSQHTWTNNLIIVID